MSLDQRHFAIQMNNVAVNGRCPMCGERTDPSIGPELFLAGSWQEVCWTCGHKHAPELMWMLEAYHGLAHIQGRYPDQQEIEELF